MAEARRGTGGHARRLAIGVGAALAVGLMTLAGAPKLMAQDRAVEVAAAPLPFQLRGEAPQSSSVLLSVADADLYRRIFSQQAAGRWGEADAAIRALGDRRLLGHVLFQRYMHPTAYRSSFAELRDWLAAYADLPGADRIYRLALDRRGSAPRPPAPVTPPSAAYGSPVERYGVAACAYNSSRQRNPQVESRVVALIREDAPTRAYDYLQQNRGPLTATEFDRLQADIAASYYFNANMMSALELASASAGRSGGLAPRGDWIAGLASWQLGEYAAAARHFQAFSVAECSGAWGRAGGAFWAARAYLRSGDMPAATRALTAAAAFPRTFYGLLARRVLGLDTRFDFAAPALGGSHWAALAGSPAALRAVGLLQVGQPEQAEAELLRVSARDGDRSLQEAVIALAQEAGLARAAVLFGGVLTPGGPGLYDGALYPIMQREPAGGYSIDPALIHAIMRTESRFQPDAVSIAGARGLMQLMPSTATGLSGVSYRGDGRDALFDIDLNMRLGQRYIAELMRIPSIGTDLLRIAASYNAGPGNLERWLARMPHQNDPLLFLESMPLSETRAYVERVLAGYWIYSMRLGRAAPSLDDIAAGRWPRFVPGTGAGQVAENAGD